MGQLRAHLQISGALGTCENIVVASNLAAIIKCPLLGLAIQCGNVAEIGAHRVILLTEGTQKTVVHALPIVGLRPCV